MKIAQKALERVVHTDSPDLIRSLLLTAENRSPKASVEFIVGECSRRNLVKVQVHVQVNIDIPGCRRKISFDALRALSSEERKD